MTTALPDLTRPAGSLRDTAPAVLAGLTAIGLAAYQVLTPGAPGATFGSLEDWLRDLGFLAYLLASIAAIHLARAAGRAQAATAWLVGVGYGLVAIGAAAGLALQDDPDWFFLLAGPGLLLSTAGFVVWTVVAIRRRLLPVWAALWCCLGGLVAIVGSEAGTSVLIGTFWLWYAATRR